MTCQLLPSWKPYFDDVRRLPPGVRPEDVKGQYSSGSKGSYNNCSASGAAGNRCKCLENWKQGLPLHNKANAGLSSKTTSAQIPRKEDDSNPTVLEGHSPEEADTTNIGATQVAFNDAMSKISCAADTIKRARNILASVGTSRQANNNNNPEISCGNGSSQESGDAKSGHCKSDKDITGGRHDKTPPDLKAAEGDTCVGEHGRESSMKMPLNCPDENCPPTNFPVPILVKTAGPRTDTAHVRFADIEDVTSSLKELSTSTDQNSFLSDPGVSGSYNQTSNADGLSMQSSASRKSSLPSRHLNTGRLRWDSRAMQTEVQAQRSAHQSRVNGQLYRYPANTAISQPNSRTQQAVSLGGTQSEKKTLPTPVNVPIRTQSTKPLVSENLGVDISALDTAKNTQQTQRRHRITLAHFNSALELAMRNLQKLDTWTVSEKSLNTDTSPQTRSTVSNFTLTEVESLNIPPDCAEKDSPSSDTVENILSDLIEEATNSAHIDAGGDSMADQMTEVENILCVPHRSPNGHSLEAELGTNSQRSCSKDEVEMNDDINRTNSSSPRQTDVLPNSISPSVSENSQGSAVVGCKSHVSFKTLCEDMLKSNSPYRNSTHKSAECLQFHDSPRPDTGLSESKQQKELRRDEKLNESAAIASENADPQINHTMNDTNITLVRHSNMVKSEEISYNNIRPILKFKVSKVKSADDCNPVKETEGNVRPQRQPSAKDRTKLEGDNCVEEITATKGGDDFPPHFPEAGDTVENLTKCGEDVLIPFASNDHGVIRNEIPGYFKEHAASDRINSLHGLLAANSAKATMRRKRRTEPNAKRIWQKTAKRLKDIQIGKSNNASLHAENKNVVETSESCKERNEALKQPDGYIVPSFITTEAANTHDDVVEINITQEEHTPVIALRQGSDHGTHEDLTKQPSVSVSQSNARLYNEDFKDKPQDYSDSSCDHSDGIRSSFDGTPDSTQSEVDTSVSITKKSVALRSVAVETPLSAAGGRQSSPSIGRRSLRKTRSRSSKVEHINESASKKVSKPTDNEKPTSCILVSASSRGNCIDILPGLLPEENDHASVKIPAPCVKSTLVLRSRKDSPPTTPEYNIKSTFSTMLDKMLEGVADNHGEVLVSSGMTGKGSSNSSRSSSIDNLSVPRDGTLVPTLVSSSVAIAPAATPPRCEERQRTPGGIKARLRRFFAQCLHPFANRN